ncbi:MAG: selenocysteine-specific elongation factor [Bradymonadia bacterium]|jgi:selenocysteine-specific elongation factor
MLLGTAGHVDHGKTTLVRALTGVDCDRLEEERARGITIELGFAAWDLPDGRRIDIVDVPGHERLVRTMLVGAGGMDAVLLAIAADSGVMPQTREHLAACAALGITRGVIALTRADLVDDVEAAMASVAQDLAGTVLANAPIVAVCAPSGEGILELTAAVGRLLDAWQPPPDDAPVFLPVDRVFTIDGAGTVVTGTLIRGVLRVGDTVAVIPGPERARVRGLQNHGVTLEEARPGRRIAVNLAVPKAAMKRGAVLGAAGAIAQGRVLDVAVHAATHLTKPLHRLRGVTLHLGASRVLGDLRTDTPIEPGNWGTARMRLERAIPLPPGARFVLRGAADRQFGAVVGGGRVLDAAPPRKRATAVRVQLADDAADGVAILVQEAGQRGLDPTGLAQRLPITPLDGPQLFSPSVVDAAAIALIAQVDAWHADHPELPGLPAAQLRTPLTRAALVQIGDVLVHDQGVLRRPTHAAALSADDAVFARKLMRAVGRSGLDGQTFADLDARFVHADAAQINRVLAHLTRIVRVAKVGDTWVAAREADAVRRSTAQAVLTAPLTVADFKTLTGTTRRRAIPLLEWLDGIGVTRRDGSTRVAGLKAQTYANPDD